MNYRRIALGLSFAGLGAAVNLSAADVVAVLSSGSAPYQAALEGLKSVLGDVPSAVLPDMPPMAGVKVVVTFGSEAALKDYPSDATLVAALLPDPSLDVKHSNATKVGLFPTAAVLAAKVKAVDSKVATLAVLNANGTYGDYIDQLGKAAGAAGFKVKAQKVESLDDVTSAVGGFKGGAEALWIPPDPLLMNPKTFAAIKDGCASAGIALIAPVSGLARAGALAGIAPSFKQVGKAAGLAAKSAASGSPAGDWYYPGEVETCVNKTVAGTLGVSPASDAADSSVE